MEKREKKREEMNKDRAWIEINRNHLENNINDHF